jgi:hypothetical protein
VAGSAFALQESRSSPAASIVRAWPENVVMDAGSREFVVDNHTIA